MTRRVTPSPRRPRDGLVRLLALAERVVQQSPTPEDDFLLVQPDLVLVRHLATTKAQASLYRPIVCLILQGQKEVVFAGETARVKAGQALLISHDVPIVARALRAPYLALIVQLDTDVLRSLEDELPSARPSPHHARALEVCEPDDALVDTLHRYLALHDASPTDLRVLGAMLRRELHYRLLSTPLGGMLRSLLRADSQASAVARAIAILRREFRTPLEVPRLAREVGMSASSFHKHFRDVTASSPLQYQKDLRLLEARRLLATGRATVTSAAFDVGYESPSQFSREYARKFGKPPSHDLRTPEPAPD